MTKNILTGGTEWIVRNVVGNLHVGEPLHVAMAAVLTKKVLRKAGSEPTGSVVRNVLAQAAWFARKTHRVNRAEYRAVMGG